MPKPMSIYKIEKPKIEKDSFAEIRGNRLAYHKYGNLATYANETQANNKVEELRAIGYACFRQYQRPYLVLLEH